MVAVGAGADVDVGRLMIYLTIDARRLSHALSLLVINDDWRLILMLFMTSVMFTLISIWMFYELCFNVETRLLMSDDWCLTVYACCLFFMSDVDGCCLLLLIYVSACSCCVRLNVHVEADGEHWCFMLSCLWLMTDDDFLAIARVMAVGI